MAVHEGEFVSVVGPNGAGKTTLVNLLTGLLPPTEGEVLFMGHNIAGVGPVALADRGLARAFQLIQIFPKLTVAETIAAAVVSRQKKRWRMFTRLSADAEVKARVREVAEIFGLRRRLETVAAALSQGEKKLLDVASAFALDPQVILLDEPTSGVSTADKHTIMQTLIAAAKRAGVKGIVLVEHDMDLVAAYSHRIIALSEGQVLADLPPDQFFADPKSDRDRDRQAEGALMLAVRDLAVDIQGSRVLRGVSFDVAEGELVCLVGRNGAGKTTTFRSIMGFRKPVAGSIDFNGQSLLGLRPYRDRAAGPGLCAGGERGVRRTHGRREHRHADLDPPLRPDAPSSGLPRPTGCSRRSRAIAIAAAQALSGGERKMVSIARALALDPRLLLLDEPTEGLSPAIVPSIVEGLANIRSFGHAVFIAESNIHHVPDFTDRLYVIERGEIIFAGKPAEARRNKDVARVIEGTVQAAGLIESPAGP